MIYLIIEGPLGLKRHFEYCSLLLKFYFNGRGNFELPSARLLRVDSQFAVQTTLILCKFYDNRVSASRQAYRH